MEDFTRPDILKSKAIQIPNFRNNTEAVQFVLDFINKQNIQLQEIIKTIMETSYRDLAYRTYFFNILCQEQGVDYEKTHKEIEEFLDKNWDKIKGDAQDRIDIEKRINEIFKDKNK
ncbi:MAG: hypothetical protein NT014_00045 [Candidatus Omnitrophica bacterium]|nr:hypothetical protein [Candidatus Omnitrophota bacterium]